MHTVGSMHLRQLPQGKTKLGSIQRQVQVQQEIPLMWKTMHQPHLIKIPTHLLVNYHISCANEYASGESQVTR